MIDIKIKLHLPDPDTLLHSGDIISENKFGYKDIEKILKIKYMDILYHVKIINNDVVSIIQWDNLTYQENENDLCELEDIELFRLHMFADRDRKENPMAERVYWLCVKEINRRFDEKDEKLY